MLYYLFQYLDQTLQVSGTGVFFSTLHLDQHLHLFLSLLLSTILWKKNYSVFAKSTGGRNC
jgi:phospho-N-acetylmuramoyl-pentapeptide-transferase